jgi:TolA-binding protein
MRRYNLAILILVILFGAGCGLSNTMYNARNYFKAAQARPLNSNGRPSPQAVEEYTKTIQKCGIIISERKSGKQVEEALFLMSQALYFKGNSAFQAKDQFENLIRLFPESEYIPDANIFLAKIYREINQPAEAESRLEAFIRDNKFRDYHPKALLTLADFEILDKDYLRAEFWLQRIITDYPDSKESYEAYFLMGKNLYVQKLYEQSNRQLEQLVDIRKASRN